MKKTIAGISHDVWTPMKYTDAVYDETAGRWVSAAEVAETEFTAGNRLDQKLSALPLRLLAKAPA